MAASWFCATASFAAVIVVDKDGKLSLEFNTEGMFRGARDSGGRREIAIY